jgi:uncharacterized protein YkwD
MTDRFTDWYFMVNNWRGFPIQRGPFTASRIQAYLKTGEITVNTLIRNGSSPWMPIGEVPRFAAAVQKANAKSSRSEFWRKYRAGILLVVLIFCAVVYSRGVPRFVPEVRERFPQVSPEPSKPVGSVPAREALTAQAIITLTNNTRALNGLSPLKANPLLNAIAESRAKDMLEKQYFAHVSPTGEQASDIAQNIGYHYKIIAENIGGGNFYTNQKIIDGWTQSPGHRKNILTREIEEMGAAVLKGDMNGAETYITVQIFGLQSPPVPQHICVGPPENRLGDIEIKKAEIAGLIDQSHRLKQELDSESEAIDSDRGYTFNDPPKISSLNIRIRAHNEKSRWYNRVVVDAEAKSVVLSSMVNEYNRMLQAYNDCRKAN